MRKMFTYENGRWYATDLNGNWPTARETAKAIANGAACEFVD